MQQGSTSKAGKLALISVAIAASSGVYIGTVETSSESTLDVLVSSIFLLSVLGALICAAIISSRVAAKTGIFKLIGRLLGFIVSLIPAKNPTEKISEMARRESLKDYENATRRATYNAMVDYKNIHGNKK